MVQSVRYNNPGNLRDPQTGNFRMFPTPQAGMAAMQKDLTAKVLGQSPAMAGKFGEGYAPTIENIISTWAPQTENDTANYIKHVSNASGLAPDLPLTAADIEKIMPAMIQMEGGKEAVSHFGTPVQYASNTGQMNDASGGGTMDVEMPDGTVIEGVPAGTTKAQLMQKLGAYNESQPTQQPEAPAAEQRPGSYLGQLAQTIGHGLKSATELPEAMMVALGRYDTRPPVASPRTEGLADKLFAGIEDPGILGMLGSAGKNILGGNVNPSDVSGALLEKFGQSVPGKAAEVASLPFAPISAALERYAMPAIVEATGIAPENIALTGLAASPLGLKQVRTAIVNKLPLTGKKGSALEELEAMNTSGGPPDGPGPGGPGGGGAGNPFVAATQKPEGEIFTKTAGQRTQDPELQRMEQAAASGNLTKDAMDTAQRASVIQNREFHNYIDNLAGGLDKGRDVNSIVEGIGNTLTTQYKTQKQTVNSAYDLARDLEKQGGGVKIGRNELQQGLWKNIADIRRDNAYDLSQMPQAKSVLKRLAKYSTRGKLNTITATRLSELENWRKQATNASKSSTDPVERKFLGEMVARYDDFMQNTADSAVELGDAQAINAFRTAVKERRELGRLFEDKGIVESIVKGEKSVDDTVRSLMASGSLKNKAGMASNLDAILRAAGKEADNVKADMKQAFAQKIFRQATDGLEPGNPNLERVMPGKLKKELENLFVDQKEFAIKLYGKEAHQAALQAIKELELISKPQPYTRSSSGSAEYIGWMLNNPLTRKVPGFGLLVKAAEAQKSASQGAKATEGFAEFADASAPKPKSKFWKKAPKRLGGGAINAATQPTQITITPKDKEK